MIKLMQADDWFKTVADNSVQLFVLDPPYNVGYGYNTFKDNKPQDQYIAEQVGILNCAMDKLKDGGSVFYLNYPENAADVWGALKAEYKFKMITWIYNVHSTGSPLRKAHRSWLWLSKGKPFYNEEAFAGEYKNPKDKRVMERIAQGFKPSGYDWWEVQQVKNVSKEKRDHPCQLPESMVTKIILGTTKPGDLVCDVYSGSGTTAISAIRNGRLFNGCDMDKKYVDESNAFLQTLTQPSSSSSSSSIASNSSVIIG
jgi:DNA modification methylase